MCCNLDPRRPTPEFLKKALRNKQDTFDARLDIFFAKGCDKKKVLETWRVKPFVSGDSLSYVSRPERGSAHSEARARQRA